MKSVVALVLAGGTAEKFHPGSLTHYKALLPVNGRPMVEIVLQALNKSMVEQIFVIQDQDACFQKNLSNYPKCIFFNKDKLHSSFGSGILYALGKIARHYEYRQLPDTVIMIVPCDIPLATADAFNALLNKAMCRNADIIFTIIKAKKLKKQCPHLSFRSIYLADYKDRFTLQNIVFVNGSKIDMIQDDALQYLKPPSGGAKEYSAGALAEMINGMREYRFHWCQLFHCIYTFLICRLIKRRRIFLVGRLLFSLLSGRLTIVKIIEYISTAFQVRPAFIESETAELSADIDRPEDLLWVTRNRFHDGAMD